MLWYNHTIEYYSAIKGNELLIHATWVDLKFITLSEKSQSYEVPYVIPFIQHSQNVKIIEMEIKLLGCQGLGMVEAREWVWL